MLHDAREEIVDESQKSSPELVEGAIVECSCVFQVNESKIGTESDRQCESVCQPSHPGKKSVACKLELHNTSVRSQ